MNAAWGLEGHLQKIGSPAERVGSTLLKCALALRALGGVELKWMCVFWIAGSSVAHGSTTQQTFKLARRFCRLTHSFLKVKARDEVTIQIRTLIREGFGDGAAFCSPTEYQGFLRVLSHVRVRFFRPIRGQIDACVLFCLDWCCGSLHNPSAKKTLAVQTGTFYTFIYY